MSYKIVIGDYPDSMMSNYDLETKVLKEGLGKDTEIVVYPYGETYRKEFAQVLSDADALLTAFTPIDAQLMDAAPQLQIISNNATGYDNVDLPAATERGIGVSPVGEYCTKDVAEFTVGFMLALVKNLKCYIMDVSLRGDWKYNAPSPNPRLEDMTLGIFGFGKIGKMVAAKVRSLGVTVIAHDLFVDPALAAPLHVELVSKEEVFERADIISNHMNLDSATTTYFTQKEFAQMTRKPFFLNLGRGASVSEVDLVDALDTGQIKGAALDVLSDETPDLHNHPLAYRDNVIITPHAAFYSTSSLEDLKRKSSENIVHFLKGEDDCVFKLANTPNPQARALRAAN
jgi:D-3-phosphoglycerate dehydrogenase